MNVEALEILLREHRDVEAHLEAAQQWIPALRYQGAAAMDRMSAQLLSFGNVIREDLALHIAHEDRALFPVLARHIGDSAGPIAMMLMEHRHLESSEAAFREGMAKNSPAIVAGAAASIVEVLTAHIWKEENVLFPVAERALSEGEWAEVLKLIRAQ